MAPVRHIVLDVLKPHEPSMLEFTQQISNVDTVDGVTTSLVEHDQEVQTVTIALTGEELAYESIESTVENLGGTVHSVDRVACGEYVVDGSTPQHD